MSAREDAMRRLLSACLLAGATTALTHCGAADERALGTGGVSGVGGDLATGAAGATGGAATGGLGAGDLATGGAGTGGLAAGGTAAGGAPSGGALAGGAATGGLASGGAATGGLATGGAANGGAAAGGTSLGGTASGGGPSGGAATGGTIRGGAPSGGTSIGGAESGGAPSDGEVTGGAASGGLASAGTAGSQVSSGGSGDGGSAGAAGGDFELAWEDPFDNLDLARWELMTHSWDGNLAQFTAENATVAGGRLRLSLTAANDATKPYRGVEMRSRETLTYGKVEVSTRFAAGSAVVSSLVLIYTPWPPDDWNELDIEFLGKNTDRVQFNHMINIPPADPETSHLQFPQLVTLPFNPAADFHTFAIEWVPGQARFVVDGALLHTATEEMARMVRPQNILLTIWASAAADWAGPVDSTTAPTSAEYDWIRVYRYVGPGG